MVNNTNGQTIINLQEIPVREIWSNEARNFTPWLAENISRLSEKINMELTVIECEKSVGPFSADIYAEDERGNKVIIENQLERTDHDHLGKMITYAAGLKGKTMVWIADKARPEHASAVNWLNAMDTDIRFYLIELLAHRINDIDVTMDFRVVCEPNDVTNAIKTDNKDNAMKDQRNIKFWTQLKVIDATRDNMYTNVNVLKWNYIGTTAITGAIWDTGIRSNSGNVQLYIYDNKPLYDIIESHKIEIEEEFGEPLMWINKDGQKATRITSVSNIGGIKDEDKWNEIQHDLIDRMSRLKCAIEKYLK